ncbi:Rrt12 protein [Saccharomycopsis crataegensis]|uniref:Rrt12 protein n=1 Tax=Saccharomycopsis crataegensis TaxID=43959 RepID=A0AAV5QPE6_9ASCO|nr:Rrt12 protein [Saccharomycopsis crataegensis]
MVLPNRILRIWMIPLVTCTQYFIQLKAPSTVEALLQSDDTVKAIHHLRPFVEKAFSFGSFEGFSGSFDSDVLARLRKNPLVEEITPDIVVKTCNKDARLGDRASVGISSRYESQHDAPRHLARLSSREALDGDTDSYQYHYPREYQGANVDVYVIDTGIQCDNIEFEGRCSFGKDFTGEGPGDNNGHGTHVSGIIGSKSYGVAKKINLIDVKALDRTGTGSLSSIISGIEFAVNHYKETNSSRKAIINLSIGAFRNSVLNRAVEVAFKSGLVLVVAAGNSNIDACATSPASAKYAITVGAIDDKDDKLAGFSNWGRCVNVLASGVRVISVNAKGMGPLMLSGTSMSTPSVTGLVGLLLESGISPEDVKQRLKEAATMGAVPRLSLMMRPITPNRIAYLPYGGIDHERYDPYHVDVDAGEPSTRYQSAATDNLGH